MVYFLHMKIKLSPQQIQKTILSPQMQQSIAVLVLPITELSLAIDQELQNNPLLEIDEETEKEKLSLDHKTTKTESIDQEVADTPYQNSNLLEEELPEERPLMQNLPLEDSLFEQLRWEISDPLKLKIGELIIGNLDEHGYLKVSAEELAQMAGVGNLDLIEEILAIVRGLDPVGIGARNLEECLITQLRAKLNGQSNLACQIVLHHLEDLAEKRYFKIARQLKTTPEEIQELGHIIGNLEPRPARNYRPIGNHIYIKPDVTIRKTEDNHFDIYINRDGVPAIQVSPTYKNMLRQNGLNEEERQYIKEKLKNALNFIKSIEQRGHTLYAIARYISEKQNEFLEGNLSSIAPMRLKDVASVLGRNESTICRAINNKYVETPQGIFPLKFFFSQALMENSEKQVSARGLQEEIKELIDNEDTSKPLSDQEIQEHFERKGMKIARRTISKYRQILKIESSHLRRKA